MKNRISLISLLVSAVLLLTACAAQSPAAASGVQTSAVPASSGVQAQAVSASAAAVESVGSVEPLSDPADAALEATDDFQLTGEGVTQDGSIYTITQAGEYTASGCLSEGQIVIDAGDDAEVKLTLSGVSITCQTDAPIAAISASELTVKSEDGTYNVVTDARTGDASTASGDDNRDAAIYAACDLKLSGKGTLIVNAAYDNGVKSKDDLSIKNVTLKVTAVGNALKGNDSVSIKSGALILISTASDGVKTVNSDVSSKGNQRGTVSISGGTVDIYAACDGISAAYNVEISEEEATAVHVYTASYASDAGASLGGTETYLIVPTSMYSENSDYYAYLYNDSVEDGVWVQCVYDSPVYSGRTAAYAGLVLRIPDGYRNILFQIVSAGTEPDGTNYEAATTGETINGAMNGYLFQSAENGVIAGDWVTLQTGSNGSGKTTYSSKGIKAANEILLSGGCVEVQSMDDGLHANADDALESGAKALGNITVSGGTLTVTAADDGLHADNALLISGGTVNVVQSHEGLEANTVTIAGGVSTVYGSDDGINACSGSATPSVQITGGYLEVTTPSGDTDAIDSNGVFVMSGGTVLVKGGASMGGMAGSVDVDQTVTVTGGTIVALGGVCQIPSGSSVNTYVSGSASFSAGSYTLTASDGTELFSFTLDGSYSGCWIASDAFALGESYSLNKDGSAVLSWTQSSSVEGSYNSGWGGGFGGDFGGGGFGGRR